MLKKAPRLVKASYALFVVAVLAALLKLGGISGAKPFILRMVPATPVAKATEPATRKELGGEPLDLPEAQGYTVAERLLTGILGNGEAPAFHRSSLGSARGADGGSGEPVCGDLGDFPKSSRAVFPLSKAYFDSYEDTWGAPRPQGGHEGTDLMSPIGTPEFAITDGTIVPVLRTNKNGWNTLGGYTVMLEAAYDVGPVKKGDLFYYAHLDQKSTLPLGTEVRAGEQIGVVGDTGEGAEGTRGKFPPHLHLGWYAGSASSARTNLESGAMNPYPLLLWLEKNGGAVTGGTDASYCEVSQGPVPEPSADEGSRPAPDLPGAGPDLDTGSVHDAQSSPAVEESRPRHDRSPKRENGTDEKSGSSVSGGQINAADGSSNAGPAVESGKDGGAGADRGGSSAPGEDRPAASESVASRPPVGGNSSGTKTGEKNQSLFSDPYSPSDWASRPFYALTDALYTEMTKDGDKKKERKTSSPPEGKGPRSTGAKERSQPAARKPEKSGGSPASCGSPGKVGEGHEVRVTRDRVDGRQAPIKRDEWLRLVKDDPEMRACGAGASKAAGQTLRRENEGLVIWTGDPDRGEVRFALRGGNVVVENPDKPTIEKMRRIADALGAGVEVEDGEKH